jgi:hypothetical protein
MSKVKMIFVIFLLLVFLLGLYIYVADTFPLFSKEKAEAFSSGAQGGEETGSGCPNLLVQRGNVLMLYNTNKPIVDGENPIPFFNLDEYINYLEIQKSRGIECPALYLQQESNAQGEDVYRMRPSPFDLQGGLPTMTTLHQKPDGTIPPVTKVADAGRENAPYNANNYPGFDPYNMYTGVYTDIDIIHDSTGTRKISDNPMDANWAGVTYTQQMVDSGKYAENAITKPVLSQPKTTFHPTLPGPGGVPLPKDKI